MNKSLIFKSISNKRFIKATLKSYSTKSPLDLIKCHFHLISKLNGHPYKTIKILPSNIEIREYEASIWIFTKQKSNTIVGNNHEIPFHVCEQYPKFIDKNFRVLMKNFAKNWGLSSEQLIKDYNQFIHTQFEINNVTFKEISSLTVAAVRSYEIENIQDYLNDRKKIIQELENENLVENYDLENLFTASFNQLIPIKSFQEVWVRKTNN